MPTKPGHVPDPPPYPGRTRTPQTSEAPRKRAPTKAYIPRYRSGAWAILRALDSLPGDPGVTKPDIIREAQQYCETSFDVPLQNKYYTAWNSMKTLLEKGYVYQDRSSARYCLTEEGEQIAKGLAFASEGYNPGDDGRVQKRRRSDESTEVTLPNDWSVLGLPQREAGESREFGRTTSNLSLNAAPRISLRRSSVSQGDLPMLGLPERGSGLSRELGRTVSNVSTNAATTVPSQVPSNVSEKVIRAGSYTIQFIMDNREVHSRVDRERLEREIGQGGIDYAVRTLDIGDALWIAKSGSEEYVLDYIVERKRMDDLVNSIQDGRFHEQKVFFR
jgi:crossover junction endonuclease MUS81